MTKEEAGPMRTGARVFRSKERPKAAEGRPRAWSRRLGILSVGAALLLSVASCATVPKYSAPAGTALTELLPSNAFAYLSVKVAKNAGLIRDVVGKSGLDASIPTSVLDKTSRMFASVEQDRQGKVSFSLVGEGDYPVGLIAWKLNWNRHWHRSNDPLRWWQDEKTGTQIAVPTKSVVLVSNGRMRTMLTNLTDGAPEALNPTIRQAFESSDLVLYFRKVGENLHVLGMEAARFPVQSFYLAITADERGTPRPGYHGFAVFKMNSDRDARLFSVVFKLLIASSENGSAIKGFPIPLRGAQLSVDGDTIRLSGISVAETDLADLLSAFISGRRGGAPS